MNRILLAALAVSALALPTLVACSGGTPEPTPKPAPDPAPDDGKAGKGKGAKGKAERGDGGAALEVLSATSGADVALAVDGDPATHWKPVRDPDLEGLLLRFEEPTVLDSVRLTGCDAAGKVTIFVDGQEVGTKKLSTTPEVQPFGSKGKVRSLYFRLAGANGTCLAEIEPLLEDAVVNVRPPKTVKGDVAVSSTLEPAAAYAPSFLFDGRTHFGWVEGDTGTGAGQWFEVTFAASQTIEAIDLWNGYQRSSDHFRKNGRVRKIAVSMGDDRRELDVEDKNGRQTIEVGKKPMEGKKIRVEILEVVAGSEYKDTVISEVRFRGGHGPFGVETPRGEEDEERRADLKGKPVKAAVGRAFESRCKPELGTLKLRGDASFVWYGAEQEEDGNKFTEILDGAWVLSGGDDKWSEVNLYARRQVVEERWQPYGETERKESTRVTGGEVKIASAASLGKEGLAAEIKAWNTGATRGRVECIGDQIQELVDANAILVKGTTLTDVLVPAGKR